MTKYFKLLFILILFIVVWTSLYYFSENFYTWTPQSVKQDDKITESWSGNIESNSWTTFISEDISNSVDEVASNADAKKYELLKENQLYKKSIETGDNFFVENRLIAALKNYQSAKKIVSDSGELDVKIANVYFELKNYKLAFKHYKNNDEIEGFSKEKELLSLFYNYYELWESDIETIKKEIEWIHFSEEERIYYLNSLQCVTDFSKCKQFYQDYFALETDIKLTELQRIKDGIDAYFWSGTDDLHFKNALIIGKFFENRHYAMVIKLGKDVLDSFPEYNPVIQMIAKSYYELWEYDLAHETLKPLHEKNLSDPKIAYFIWVINMKRKYFLSSSINFTRALEAGYEPKIEVKRKLVYNYFLIENKDKMYSLLNDLLYQDDVAESDFALWIYQALQDKKFDTALEYAKRWSARFPESSRFYWYIGDIYMRIGKMELAIEALEKGKIINPKDVSLVYYEWRLFMEQGEYNKAFLAFRRVISLSKGSWEFINEANSQLNIIKEKTKTSSTWNTI